MAGRQDRSTYPVRPESVAKVHHLQRRLWAAAKRSPGRRFHALYDRIHRDDVLWTAWDRVRRRRGAGGVDRQTLADVEQYGLARFLAEIQADLRAKRYRPQAVRRRYIEKSGGGRRPLGIPTVRDRVVQAAGTPQGGVISPLLANVYLHVLDRRWRDEYAHLGTLVRYADDFVVMCDTAGACAAAEETIRGLLDELSLELHDEKTTRVELTNGKGGFDFLGCHLHKRMSGRLWERYGRRRYYLQRWPSAEAMKSIRTRIRARVGRHRNGGKDVRALVRELNPLLRGWCNFFRTGNAAQKFNQLDTYVWRRLRRFLIKRKGRHLKAGEAAQWTSAFFWSLGLVRLRGTVTYPGAA